MNYQDIYSKIITFRKFNLPLNTYTEKHHIIPKCLGGDNSKENLVVVSTREHYLLHHLLVKIYPENRDLKNAFMWIKTRLNIEKNSNPYQCIRKCEYKAPLLSNEHKQKISESHKGKIISDEHKQKISESHKGKKLSEEHKQKIAEYRKGKTLSEETKRKLSESKKGKKRKPLSDEHKQKLSESLKGKKHKKHKPLSEETKRKISESTKNRIGKIFVNNGIINKLAFPNEIPNGFVKGKLNKVLL